MFDLSGRRALVTGAGRGIGRAVAVGLARAGADVAVAARTEDQVREAAAEIEALGRKAAWRSWDLDRVSTLPDLAAQVESELGGIDVLVNNAGVNIPQKAEDVTEEAWDRVMDLNAKAAFFLSQAVGRRMIERRTGGRIINISSQTGQVALIKRSAYCASKAAMNLVTKVLALEWAEHGILVNAVAPTFIETEMTKPMFEDPEFRAYALGKNLLGEFGTPEDVVGAVVYLASPAARLVTGQVLLVDAGWTAH
jgi:2-deoxy-D-gluconate 3-dehydrogenase